MACLAGIAHHINDGRQCHRVVSAIRVIEIKARERRAPLSPLLGDKGCETNGFNQFDKIAFWKTPQAQGGKFVPYSRWTQDYIAIMGGR